jgi:SEC-C motif
MDERTTTPFHEVLAREDVLWDGLVAAARSAPEAEVVAAVTAAVDAELQWMGAAGEDRASSPPTLGTLAAELAGELRLAGAVDALVRCLEGLDSFDPLAERCADALVRIGSPAVDPLLRAYEAAPDDHEGDARDNLAGALFQMGPRRRPLTPEQRARIDEIRAEEAAREPDELAPDEDLEDDFTEAEWAEAKRLAVEELLPKPLPVRHAPTLARNAPCHCGSGKKYKKCHLASDEERARAGKA